MKEEEEKMKKRTFVKKLLALLSEATGCGVQHNGCPCNNCFHFWTTEKLKLHPDVIHLFWLVVLVLRGDHKKRDITSYIKEAYEDIIGD